MRMILNYTNLFIKCNSIYCSFRLNFQNLNTIMTTSTIAQGNVLVACWNHNYLSELV